MKNIFSLKKKLMAGLLVSVGTLLFLYQNAIYPPSAQPPKIFNFTLPRNWIGLTVPIYNFDIASKVGIKGFLISTVNEKPSKIDQRWTTKKPGTFSFKNPCPEDHSSGCPRTAYAWVMDVNGLISEAAVANVQISNPNLTLAGQLTAGPQNIISKNLFGVHFVYSEDKDEFYTNSLVNGTTSTFSHWVKNIGSGVARYPGGTVVKYWDWENPTGILKCDRWDTNFTLLTDEKEQNACYLKNLNGQFAGFVTKDDSEFTDLDEYLKFIEESDVTPLVGVNILSGVSFDKFGASIWRAKRLVKYLVGKGKMGAFYYLGNEDMGEVNVGLQKVCAPGWYQRRQEKSDRNLVDELCKCVTNPIHNSPVKKAGCNVKLHARAIKSIDPEAKIFWNDNAVNEQTLSEFLSVANDFVDGVEFHSKWPYSGDIKCKGLPPYTLAMWQNQFPFKITRALCDRNNDTVSSATEDPTHKERVEVFKKRAKSLGKNNLLLANNEWGLTPGQENFVEFNRFHYSLVLTEYLQDLLMSGMDMAALWQNIVRPGSRQYAMTKLMDANDSQLKLNPVHYAFEMLKTTKGKGLYPIKNGNKNGYGFIAYDGYNKAEIFLLNKSSEASRAVVTLEVNKKIISVVGESLVDDVNDEGHWGTMKATEAAIGAGGEVLVVLPPLSYSKIVVSLDK